MCSSPSFSPPTIKSPPPLLCLDDVEASHVPVPGPHPSSTKAVKVAFLRHKCEGLTPCFTLSDGFGCSPDEKQVPNLTWSGQSLLSLPSWARFASLCPARGALVASACLQSIHCALSLPATGPLHKLCRLSRQFLLSFFSSSY